jgi:hypothetical protein
MSTGSITITPGKVFNAIAGERVDLPKLNLLGTPTARVDENSIGRRELINAFVEEVDGVIAGLATEITVRADADTALSNSITTLSSTVDDNTAAITAEATARADADTALANSISTLSSTVDGNTAAITAEATARATADGFLEGKYALQVTAGDVVTGMIITSASGAGTPVSQVRFQADKFQIWNGTAGVPVFDLSGSTIRLNADVVVLGSITLAQVSDAGTLAGKNSVDLTTSEVTNKSLANLDATANTKLGGIEAGATVGAAWGTNLTGRPVELTDGRVATALNASGTVVTKVVPASTAAASTAGLYLGSDFLGYYNGSAWRTYMDNSGQFFLAGAGGNALAWDGSTLTIAGTLDVGTGINRAFVGEVSAGVFTIRRGIAGSNRVEMASNAGGELADYSQFRAYNSGNQLVGMLGTDALNGQGLLQLASAAGTQTVNLDGASGRAEVAESFRGPVGSVGSLPFTFTGRTTDGFYSGAAGTLVVALNGKRAFDFTEGSNVFGLEIGQGRTGDGAAYIDLRGDGTYTDYGLRLIRDGGANSQSRLRHRGSGELIIDAQENAEVRIDTNGVNRVMVNDVGVYAAGLGSFGGDVTANGDLTMTGARALYNNGVIVVKTRQSAVTRPAAIGTPSSLSGSDWTFEYATVNSNFTAVQNSLSNLRDRLNDVIDRLQDATGHGLIADSS